MAGMPIDERLGHHLKRVEQELTAVKHAAVKPTGLTVPQYSALLVLAENPGISAAAAARICLVTPQTMATILSNLESKGLIERRAHPYHRQLLEIELTPAGRKTLRAADTRAVRVEQRLAEWFTATERDQLRELLARFSEALQEEASRFDARGVIIPFKREH